MKHFKIALIHEMFVKMGGAERVIQSLLKIFPQADIYTLLADKKVVEKNFPGRDIKTSRLQKFVDWKIPRQLLVSKMPRAIEDFDFGDYDLVISSSSSFAHGIIVPSTVAHICYVHAPMRYGWDYTHEYVREKAGKNFFKKFCIEKILHTLRIWDYTAAARPDILLANSKTTQKRIQKFWRCDSQVVFPPVDTEKFSIQKDNKNENYFLIVSALEPFKSIEIAVRAFINTPEKKLIIIGDGSQKEFLEKISESAANIQFLGRKSDSVVQKYMEECTALIFPGLEDFGITPVEAMACGKPVICYGKGGVTESVIDGQTGIFFPELTGESLQKALEKFSTEEKKFSTPAVQKKIRARAEKFSEAIFARKITDAVENIIS